MAKNKFFYSALQNKYSCFLLLQLNRYIRSAFITLSLSPRLVFPLFPCHRMSPQSPVALTLVHFNCGAPLSPSFMRFRRLHYLFTTSPLFADAERLNLSCSPIVAAPCRLMNTPRRQCAALCIFALLSLRITALAVHMQTCDTRILPIVLACHRTLALSSDNPHLPSERRSRSKSPLRRERTQSRLLPGAFVNLQKNVSNLFFPHQITPLLAKSLPYLCSLFLELILTRSGKRSRLFFAFCGSAPSRSQTRRTGGRIKNGAL